MEWAVPSRERGEGPKATTAGLGRLGPVPRDRAGRGPQDDAAGSFGLLTLPTSTPTHCRLSPRRKRRKDAPAATQGARRTQVRTQRAAGAPRRRCHFIAGSPHSHGQGQGHPPHHLRLPPQTSVCVPGPPALCPFFLPLPSTTAPPRPVCLPCFSTFQVTLPSVVPRSPCGGAVSLATAPRIENRREGAECLLPENRREGAECLLPEPRGWGGGTSDGSLRVFSTSPFPLSSLSSAFPRRNSSTALCSLRSKLGSYYSSSQGPSRP